MKLLERSIPITFAPFRAREKESNPLPHPTSKIFFPFTNPIKFLNFRFANLKNCSSSKLKDGVERTIFFRNNFLHF